MRIKKQTGFTIIELLIVIVVIGILAAITVVAYSGIQNRAHDSAQLIAVNRLHKDLEMYSSLHGALPLAGPETDTSVSTVSGKYVTNARGSYHGKAEDVQALAAFESAYGLTLPSNSLYFYDNDGVAYIMAAFKSDKNIPEENRSNRLRVGSHNNAWPNFMLRSSSSKHTCDPPSVDTPQSITSRGSYAVLYDDTVRDNISADVYKSSNLSNCTGYIDSMIYLRDYSSDSAIANRVSGTGLFIVKKSN